MRATAPPRGLQKRAGNVTKPGSGSVHPLVGILQPNGSSGGACQGGAIVGPGPGHHHQAGNVAAAALPRIRAPSRSRQQGRNWSRWGRRHLRQLAARRGRLTGLLLALAVVASGAVQFTGVIAGAASPAARTPASGNPPAGSADPAGGPAVSALAAGVAVRSDFAAPSPLGLLAPVLKTDLQPAPARDRESLVRAAGEGTNQMRGK